MSLLARVSALLDRRGTRFAAIGAAALAAHGVLRATADLDLLVIDPACLDDRVWHELVESRVRVEIRRGDAADPLAGVVRIAAQGEPAIDVIVERICRAFTAFAARAVASSPSVWNMRWPPRGQRKIGPANRWPNSSMPVSIFETSTRRRGRSSMFLKALTLACTVRLSSTPLAM